jgi:hypothetical protein
MLSEKFISKETAMKKTILTVLAAGFLVALTGCATMENSYFDGETTTLLPDGTVQWSSSVEITEQAKKYILQVAWSSQEELEQLGKKVTQNLNADVNPMYKRLEQRLRTLPSGTRLVFGGSRLDQHQIAVVAFLSDDGSFEHYVVED